MRVWPSGHLIDPLSPDPELICIEDVAHHLAGIFRYGGASRLTVAQHCCEMAYYVLGPGWNPRGVRGCTEQTAYECLMHDAAEYLLGDMIAPLKHSAFGDVYRAAEANVERTLRAKFGFGIRSFALEVSLLDKRMRASEQRDLFGSDSPESIPGWFINCWLPEDARSSFLRLYGLLKPAVAQEEQAAA